MGRSHRRRPVPGGRLLSRYLIDTNIALLGRTTPERVPRYIREAVETGPTFISVISYWEVMIKSMKGLLGEIGDPLLWWREALEELQLTPLDFRPDHVSALQHLPSIHQDPFDRALIAQAIVENLVFLTTDVGIARYTSPNFSVIT